MQNNSAITFKPLFLSLLLSLYLATPAVADELSIYTISLKFREAESLLPTLTPLLPKNASLSAHGNKLILNTTADNLIQLQSLIDQLDQPLEQLLVTVSNKVYDGSLRQSNSANKVINNTKSTLSISTNNRSGIKVYKTENRQIVQRSTSNLNGGMLNQNGEYSIKVLEGHSAYIKTDQQTPAIVAYGHKNNHIYEAYNLQGEPDGFYVTPRLQGDRVTLSILAHYKQLDEQVETQTTLSGKLGDWISIVDLEQSRNEERSQYDTRKVRTHSGLFIRVEMLTN